MLSLTSLPEVKIGPGAAFAAGQMLTNNKGKRSAIIIADAFWINQPIFERWLSSLQESGVSSTIFSGFTGEPKSRHINAAAKQARDVGADAVIGLGGGSALDIAKMVSACTLSDHGADYFALGKVDLPAETLDLVLIPTTAGTGSEANGTAIFSDDTGKKLWAYGASLKPDLALLDADFLKSLPPYLMASCGLDAMIHAFEAGTNKWANPQIQAFSTYALRLIVPALPKAQKGDIDAMQDLLLGSFYAGYAIENCGTAVAHCVSHAMAGLAPIQHGFATALAFEVTIARVAGANNPMLAPIAEACGTTVADLPAWYSGLLDQVGLKRVLPDCFNEITPHRLCDEMMSEANAPMRNATLPELTETVLMEIAESILSLAKPSPVQTET